MHNKKTIFDAAVDITKEYARGGGTMTPAHVFEIVYEVLKKTAEEEHILLHE